MRVPLAIAIAAALVCVSGASGKDFRPGDLRLCNAHRCIAVTNQPALNAVGDFYYRDATPLHVVARPALGSRAYRLEYRNGYVTGIVAGPLLDRFLSYGVNLDRFSRSRWYRVPLRTSLELRRLAASLRPLRLTAAMLALSH